MNDKEIMLAGLEEFQHELGCLMVFIQEKLDQEKIHTNELAAVHLELASMQIHTLNLQKFAQEHLFAERSQTKKKTKNAKQDTSMVGKDLESLLIQLKTISRRAHASSKNAQCQILSDKTDLTQLTPKQLSLVTGEALAKLKICQAEFNFISSELSILCAEYSENRK